MCAAVEPVAGRRDRPRPSPWEPLPAPRATLAETLSLWTEQAGTLILVLDQFEQYLLHHDDVAEGGLTGFSAELVRVVRARDARVQLVSGGTWYACSVVSGNNWSCNTTVGTQATAAAANQLTVVATQ